MQTIFIIGIVQAFFIEFLLLNKKKKALPDKVLSVWMFVIGVHLFLSYLFYIEYYHDFPFFMALLIPMPLLHGPLLLFYVQSLIRPNPGIRRSDWLHFLPALAFYAFLFPDGFLQTAEELMVFAFETLITNPPFYWTFFTTLLYLSGVVYVVWALLLLRQHSNRIKDNFSYTEKINLGWLMKLILGLAGIWLVVLISDEPQYIYAALTLFVFLIGYFGSRQGVIFTDNTQPGQPAPISDPEKIKYEKSTLTEEKRNAYLQTLKAFMEEEKPHLEPKVTLKEISDQLDMHPNHLSQVINESLNVNFHDFVNQYRVEEFKSRVAADTSRKLTLLAHAYDSGYSSKSSFNEVFKKFTGLTPSQYQKSLND